MPPFENRIENQKSEAPNENALAGEVWRDRNAFALAGRDIADLANRHPADHDRDGLPDVWRGKPDAPASSPDVEPIILDGPSLPQGTYRQMTSLELVTAIYVATVGLVKGRSGKSETIDETKEGHADIKQDLNESLKEDQTPGQIESQILKAKADHQARKNSDSAEYKLPDLVAPGSDQNWLTESAKARALREAKNEVVVCSLDRRLNFVAVSESLKARWGYEAHELIGRSLMGLMRTDDVNVTLAAMREILANKTALAFEAWIHHKSGNWRAMSWSAYWSDADEKIVAIARDITDQKDLEHRRQEAVQMVSHDLRSPLTSIQFSLDMLAAGASGTLSDDALHEVRIAQNSTTQLINLVNDLLDLEKIEHGVLRMNFAVCSLNEIFESAIDTVRFFARSRKIEIKATPTKLAVFADKERIVQVLVNMLSNAIKFSADNTCITIESETNDDMAEIKVTDQGPGIPSEYKEAIFERFKQIKGREGVGQKGTGLGLAICKSIIEGHDGCIGVSSSGTAGSTFWFRVPLLERRGADRPFSDTASRPNYGAQAII